ncbi:extracellular solute-binding protein [Lederbergia sp. NSJ-179]|uniref:extracellular solute-binding protein n=1 Tax=Lederbergia sp. NSJ-179 TaxID=2931402 RepID=UPI001FD0A3D2|nr:extracellular solute-binding protein [Lederbergia sp. NSJ-179]MCJ7841533.1 extracellular solute-binding protein [Lederbergia sp. NSJ-179]
MKKLKKGLFSLTVLLTSMVLVVGCAKNDNKKNADKGPDENFNESGYPIVKEPITLTMMGQSSPVQPDWKDMGFFKEMEKMTNIQFNFKTSPSDDYKQKKQLAFNSLELPDVLYGAELTSEEELNFGSQGLLIPLEDLIDKYAPNFKKVMEEHPDIKPSITAPDGHIYALPGLDTTTQSKTPIMWMNKPWMDKIGAKTPETVDDLYQLLKDFKEKDPDNVGDVIPLTANSPADLRVGILPDFGIIQTDGIFQKGGKVDYAYTQEGFKEYLTFMNKLYNEKLLDNEMFSHTWEQFVAKGPKVGIYSTWPIVMLGFEDPSEALKYPPLPPLTSAVNDQKLTIEMPEVRRGRAAITSENKYPEATMRWLDYAYSEEGSILSRLGIEGESYEWNEDKTKWKLLSKDGLSTTETNSQYAPGVGTNVPMVLSEEIFGKEDNPTIHEINKNLANELLPYAELPFPLVYFTDDEQDRINALKPDIDTYFEQMEAKFITGAESIETGWDNYLETLEGLGIDEYIKIHQDAYDRWADEK